MAKLMILTALGLVLVLVLPGALSSKARKGQYGQPREDSDEEEDGEDDEVWLISLGVIGSRENYVDNLTGENKGFEVDIINAVCEIAEKNCEIVEDQFSNCWTTVDNTPVGGAGLFNFYYDACIGWNPTYTRARTFAFSTPYVKNRGSAFITTTGADFNSENLEGSTIGFVQGFVSSPACLSRASDQIAGAELTEDQIVWYSDNQALAEGVRNGEVDAGFDSILDYPDGIEIASDFIYCALGGNSLMTRKDSQFIEWWNPAFEELLAGDGYRAVCDNLTGEHADLPGPEAEDKCIGFGEAAP